jgi:hypothetical protein
MQGALALDTSSTQHPVASLLRNTWSSALQPHIHFLMAATWWPKAVVHFSFAVMLRIMKWNSRLGDGTPDGPHRGNTSMAK